MTTNSVGNSSSASQSSFSSMSLANQERAVNDKLSGIAAKSAIDRAMKNYTEQKNKTVRTTNGDES